MRLCKTSHKELFAHARTAFTRCFVVSCLRCKCRGRRLRGCTELLAAPNHPWIIHRPSDNAVTPVTKRHSTFERWFGDLYLNNGQDERLQTDKALQQLHSHESSTIRLNNHRSIKPPRSSPGNISRARGAAQPESVRERSKVVYISGGRRRGGVVFTRRAALARESHGRAARFLVEVARADTTVRADCIRRHTRVTAKMEYSADIPSRQPSPSFGARNSLFLSLFLSFPAPYLAGSHVRSRRWPRSQRVVVAVVSPLLLGSAFACPSSEPAALRA